MPAEWSSGLYAARLVDSQGFTFYSTFVVRPAATDTRRSLAVIANINTWNAYNDWGGHSRYSKNYVNPGQVHLSFCRPNPSASVKGWGEKNENASRPCDTTAVGATLPGNHLALAESWVLNWLEDSGFRPDVYTDADLHAGIAGLAASGSDRYKALLVTTHPEYWTWEMRRNLEAYLAAGGHLLYLGGNGMYEIVTYTSGASGGTPAEMVADLSGGDTRHLFRNTPSPDHGGIEPEENVLGVQSIDSPYNTYCPYAVYTPAHRFFNGTTRTGGGQLQAGDVFGLEGLNGGASGLELDTFTPVNNAPPTGITVLAVGMNAGGNGARMVYKGGPSGGWVFSAGSITLGGSLAVDPNVQQIVRNALNEALAI